MKERMKQKYIDLLSPNYAEKIEKCIRHNYKSPKLYTKGDKIQLILEKSGSHSSRSARDEVRNKVIDIISYFVNVRVECGCVCTIRFSHELINKMYALLTLPRETSGSFKLEKVVNLGGTYSVYDINLNESSIMTGNSDEVYETLTKFNFHTHPISAYIERGVDVAWASIEDLRGIIENENGIFHCIISVEGLYFIIKNTNVIPTEKNLKKYNILYPNPKNKDYYPYTPEQYIEYVSKFKEKVFDISFNSWKDLKKIGQIDLRVCLDKSEREIE